jgi:hypothetical protein
MVKAAARGPAVPAESTGPREAVFRSEDNRIEHPVLGDNGVLDAAQLLGHLLPTVFALSHEGILR